MQFISWVGKECERKRMVKGGAAWRNVIVDKATLSQLDVMFLSFFR